MPNIYLRLPRSRCQFFRNRDPKHPLASHEPLVFNQYMPQHFILRNYISNASALVQKVNDMCYSQQQWRNMMSGRNPLGGKVLFSRDKDSYLTFDEVQQLIGNCVYDKSSSVDYLCIRLPAEVMVVDTVRSVTPSWNLVNHGIYKMVSILNNDFKRSVIEWALSTFDYVTSNGRIICRAQTAMLERYLMRYGIEPTQVEKDNLRRVIDRWLKTEHNNFSSYSCLDMQYIDSKEKVMDVHNIDWLE